MFELALANLRANRGRLVATVVAIVAGVAFLSAGLMFTGAIKSSLGESVERQYPTVVAQLRDSGDRQGPPAKLPASLLDTARSVDGVAEATGELSASIGVFRSGRQKATGLTGRRWTETASLNPIDLVEGRAPTDSGQLALDRRTVADLDLKIGETIRLSTAIGEQTAELVGITAFGPDDSQDSGGTASIPAADAFRFLTGDVEQYDRIIVSADDGVALTTVVKRLEAIAPDGAVATGRADFLEDAQGGIAVLANILSPVLSGFAGLALFICSFVIANTFAVVVAQRTRELALLRAIGATPKQVRRSLRLEALGIGLISSALGIAVGYGLAWAATAVLAAFDIRIPGAGARLTPGIAAVSLAVGTQVTLTSVILASRRAARVAPVEAMRSAAVEAPVKKRSIWWLAPLVVGAVTVLVGGYTKTGWALGVGALLFVLGMLRCGPFIVRGAAHLGGLVFGRRIAGRLAMANIERNPRRAATTANALVIGVMLIAIVTTAGSTLRDELVSTLDDLSSTDVLVSSQPGTGFPDGLAEQIRDVSGVDALGAVSSEGARVGRLNRNGVISDEVDSVVTGGDPVTLATAAGLQVTNGSLDDLGVGTVAVVDFGAAGGGIPTPRLGDSLAITTLDGTQAELKVVATIRFSLDTLFLQNLVTEDQFATLFGPDRPASSAFIKVGDRDVREVRNDLETLTDGYSTVSVTAGNFIGQLVEQVLNVVISGVNGLLGMSVLIASIGIVNTMTLAIIERRREIGLLRAIGMIPGDARAMVSIESLVIAVVGTAIGLVTGVFLGFALTRAIDSTSGGTENLTFVFAWGRLGIIAGVGVVVGLVAAIIPMIKVSRMDVLDSLEG